MEKLLKNSLSVRGDSVYCPLCFSLDSYGNCLTDCHHCYLRNLNHVWGKDLKPADTDLLEKKLRIGIANKNPKSTISFCLSNKKTIRWGNKTDPFQNAEIKHRIAPKIFSLFYEYDWSFVIQTKHTETMMRYEKYIMSCNKKQLVTIMPEISPGLEQDWEVFEMKRTTNPIQRLEHVKYLQSNGVNIGVNGEPFIPGYHTEKDFETALKLLKQYNIQSYNTYNFHFNAFVAKRLHSIGIDIEKIWFYNQDNEWKKILVKLLDLSKKYNIRLGCPDFVNTGPNWVEKANTCCGINVPNPCTFNSHRFKQLKQKGYSDEDILKETWDGSADYLMGKAVLQGTTKKFYTLKDSGL
jgi:DNA repair photolyase